MNPTEIIKKAGSAIVKKYASSDVSATGGVLLLPANRDRKYALFANASTSILYVKYDSGAVGVSATNHTAQVPTLGVWKVDDGYTGDIYGFHSANNGNVLVTEIT